MYASAKKNIWLRVININKALGTRPIHKQKMNMNEREVWKLKEHVCVACGEELTEDEFEVYHRDTEADDPGPDQIDLVCPDCHDTLDKTQRGETEFILEEIEEEMPEASRERKTLEYLRRSQD